MNNCKRFVIRRIFQFPHQLNFRNYGTVGTVNLQGLQKPYFGSEKIPSYLHSPRTFNAVVSCGFGLVNAAFFFSIYCRNQIFGNIHWKSFTITIRTASSSIFFHALSVCKLRACLFYKLRACLFICSTFCNLSKSLQIERTRISI